jgi:maltooligosyltrehalose trehalohydrolase
MDVATVVRSTLPWAELADPAHRAVYDTYRELISLRRKHAELSDPRLDRFRVDAGDGWLVLHRGTLRVMVNLGTAKAEIDAGGPVREVLFGQSEVRDEVVTVAPDAVAIIRL